MRTLTSIASVGLLWLGLGASRPAEAVVEYYTIDTEQSVLQLAPSMAARVVFFGMVSDLVMPLQSQVGNGGAGATLPDGSVSDGLRTFVDGVLLVDVSNGDTEIEIVNRRSTLSLGNSGSWLPGLPGTEQVAADAAFGADFSSLAFMLGGRSAVRDLQFGIGHLGLKQPLTDQGGGVKTFSYNAQDSTNLAPFVGEGAGDFETDFLGANLASGRDFLTLPPSEAPFFLVDQGELLDDGNGGRQITLPIDAQIFLSDDSWMSGIPFQLSLEVSGQIVARNASFVPEPGALAQGLGALVVLVGLRWLLRTRPRARKRSALALLLLPVLIPGCAEVLGSAALPRGIAPAGGGLAPGDAQFTDFADCVGTGTSTSVAVGASSDLLTGMAACEPVGFDPATAAVSDTQGNVQVDVSATANPTIFVNLFAVVFHSVVQWQATITGGSAATPATADITANYRIPHSGGTTPNDGLAFGATFLSFADHAGAVNGTPSASVDCGAGPAILTPNSGGILVAAELASSCAPSCECTISLQISGGSVASEGETQQRLEVFAIQTPTECPKNATCRALDPATPFCVPGTGCTDGSVGMPCTHDLQCDGSTGLFCGSSGLCDDGIIGDSCSDVGDCAFGLECDAMTFQCALPGS